MTAKSEKTWANRPQTFYDPAGWHQTLLQCKRRKPFRIAIIMPEDFVSVQKLTGLNMKRKNSNNGKNLHFPSVCSFIFN
jgi:hypothetical protein